MAYGILELGAEKLIARYVGPAEHVAYNEGVLRESLASLEGRALIVGQLGRVESLEWSTARTATGQKGLPFPMGWVVEDGAPLPCAGLPQATAAAAVFPPNDFTVALRAAVWNSGVVPEEAAKACSSRRGSSGSASYVSRLDWLGVSYSVEGAFIRLSPTQTAQLEVISPDPKSVFARALLAAWVTKTTGQ
jgi:hypothetical protein